MVQLVEAPGLSAQTEVLPPRELTVDAVVRHRNREISPADAVRLAARGLRRVVLAFGFGARCPPTIWPR